MSLKDAIKGVCARSYAHGEFKLGRGKSVNEAVRVNQVPNEPGVYVILSSDDLERPVYIGKAGTLNQDGNWGEQGIRVRLTKVQEGLPRNVFFIREMERTFRNGLTFLWFVTHNRVVGIIPAFVEMELLKAHYDQFRCLPALNKSI
jgi:hypothetical protein